MKPPKSRETMKLIVYINDEACGGSVNSGDSWL